MGDRAVDRAAPWSEIDRILADTESSFDFLSLVSPLDLDQAWERFRAAGYEREPELISPDLDFEVADLRSGIDRLSLRDVDDVDIRFLLAGKREDSGGSSACWKFGIRPSSSSEACSTTVPWATSC